MKKDKVTFKKTLWGPIAVIHDAPANPGMVLSYMHLGQHGEASKDFIDGLPDCPPVDYADLRAELISLGYNL